MANHLLVIIDVILPFDALVASDYYCSFGFADVHDYLPKTAKLSMTPTHPKPGYKDDISSLVNPNNMGFIFMTHHATNGLTTLTQSKINVGARWSRTHASEYCSDNSTLGVGVLSYH